MHSTDNQPDTLTLLPAKQVAQLLGLGLSTFWRYLSLARHADVRLTLHRYRIARAHAVAGVRKEEAGELDVQLIQDQLNAIATWSDRIADMATKARTVQSSGKLIEQCAIDLKAELDSRLTKVLGMLAGKAS